MDVFIIRHFLSSMKRKGNDHRLSNPLKKRKSMTFILWCLLFLLHLPVPKMASLSSLRACSFGLDPWYVYILDLILSLTVSGTSCFCIKPSMKVFRPEISSIKAMSFVVKVSDYSFSGRSINTFGPSFCISTIRSSNYSLWTSKCSIIILWQSLFLLSQYYQLYM